MSKLELAKAIARQISTIPELAYTDPEYIIGDLNIAAKESGVFFYLNGDGFIDAGEDF